AEVGGEGGERGEVEVAVAGFASHGQLVATADRSPGDGRRPEPFPAETPHDNAERLVGQVGVAEAGAAHGPARLVDPCGEDGVEGGVHADLRSASSKRRPARSRVGAARASSPLGVAPAARSAMRARLVMPGAARTMVAPAMAGSPWP